MRLALDGAPVAADRGDPGFGAVVARASRFWPAQAVPKSLIAIRSPTTASAFSARRAVEADACCSTCDKATVSVNSPAKAEALTITMPVRGLVVVL